MKYENITTQLSSRKYWKTEIVIVLMRYGGFCVSCFALSETTVVRVIVLYLEIIITYKFYDAVIINFHCFNSLIVIRFQRSNVSLFNKNNRVRVIDTRMTFIQTLAFFEFMKQTYIYILLLEI